jgi:hypothetical protein
MSLAEMRATLAFEAAVHRLSLLVGLTREADVQAWALAWLEREEVSADLVEVVTAPPQLSPLREALAPLAASAPPRAVAVVLLSALAHDAQRNTRTVADRLHMLRLMRTEADLPRHVIDDIKAREEWHMLAEAQLSAPEVVTHASLDAWLGALSAALGAPCPRVPGVA